MTEPKFVRLGFTLDWFNPSRQVEGIYHALQFKDKAEHLDNQHNVQSNLVTKATFAVVEFYYLDDLTSARHWANQLFGFVDSYFFGGWRDRAGTGEDGDEPPDRSWWDREARWHDELEGALVFGSALHQWDFLQKLGGYFRDDVCVN